MRIQGKAKLKKFIKKAHEQTIDFNKWIVFYKTGKWLVSDIKQANSHIKTCLEIEILREHRSVEIEDYNSRHQYIDACITANFEDLEILHVTIDMVRVIYHNKKQTFELEPWLSIKQAYDSTKRKGSENRYQHMQRIQKESINILESKQNQNTCRIV